MPAIEIALCTTRPSLRILARVKISSAKERFLPAIIFTGLASSSSWRYLRRNKYQHKSSNLKLIHDKITKTIVELTLDIVLDYCYLCLVLFKTIFILWLLYMCVLQRNSSPWSLKTHHRSFKCAELYWEIGHGNELLNINYAPKADNINSNG